MLHLLWRDCYVIWRFFQVGTVFAQRGRVESQASSVPVVAKALVRIPALQFQSTRVAFFTAFLQNSAATNKSNAPLPPPPKPAPKPASSSISAMMAKVLHFTHAATFATNTLAEHSREKGGARPCPCPCPCQNGGVVVEATCCGASARARHHESVAEENSRCSCGDACSGRGGGSLSAQSTHCTR